MSTSSSFKIPKVLAINKNYLVLEFLESNGENCWRKFGKNLAELHSCYGLSFGLNSDNYIGTLNQKNLFYDKWCDFYINNRIIPLIKGLDYDKKIVNKLEKLINSLKTLRDSGNSIIVVEHDKEMILNADHIIDLGPNAGLKGGEIIYEGSPDKILKSRTLTSDYLTNRKQIEIPTKTRQGNGMYIIHNTRNGLRKR